MAGPLAGLRIVELAGLGPGPFAAMMLADHGAEVIRVERAGMLGVTGDPLLRNRRSISLDLRDDKARDVVRRLAATADGLIEGFRPGVMERLGLGPDLLLAGNPKLVIGRVTGWGQEGPLAAEAGHDIDYLALTGLLHAIGPSDGPPVPPLNLVGDYAGGGMMLAFGMVAALLAVQRGGAGQVIDVAMSDGAALVGALIYVLKAAARWTDRRGANLLDGGYPLYGCYECSDGKFVAVGAIEPQFRWAFLKGLRLEADPLFEANDWPAQKQRIADVLRIRSRDDWVEHFAGKDACVAPVLSLAETPGHPHNVARGTFIDVGGVIQPAPAPRFAEPTAHPTPPRREGEDGSTILTELGYGADEIADLLGAAAP
ncbi:MAG: CaiB/BaiF CoA transferase family protein [Sphingomicrobium sp.]|nr:CoA transferase [Sphingomonadales bacterium]